MPADRKETRSVHRLKGSRAQERARARFGESNGAQSCAKERGRCRTGERGRQGAFTGRRRVRRSYRRAAHRAAQEGPSGRGLRQGGEKHLGVPRCRGHGLRVRSRRTQGSAAVRLLEGRSRCCRSVDQGFRQGKRCVEGKARCDRRQGLPGVACRRAGLAADPRSGTQHAAQRAGAARDDAGPPAFGARRATGAGHECGRSAEDGCCPKRSPTR